MKYETIILIIWNKDEFFPLLEEYGKEQKVEVQGRIEQLKQTHRVSSMSDRLFQTRQNTVAIEFEEL